MLTWSLGTSQLIYQENTGLKFLSYKVYRSSKTDNTYVRNYYNFYDRSITLLKSIKKVQTLQVAPNTNEVNEEQLMQILA